MSKRANLAAALQTATFEVAEAPVTNGACNIPASATVTAIQELARAEPDREEDGCCALRSSGVEAAQTFGPGARQLNAGVATRSHQ